MDYFLHNVTIKKTIGYYSRMGFQQLRCVIKCLELNLNKDLQILGACMLLPSKLSKFHSHGLTNTGWADDEKEWDTIIQRAVT